MYNILEENGQVIVATDCNEYFDFIKTNFLNKQLFRENFINSNSNINIFRTSRDQIFFEGDQGREKNKFFKISKKIHK